MSSVNMINNNNNTVVNTSKELKEFGSAFPDPTEDVFWQKVSTVTNVGDDNSTNDVDAIWNPHKKESNQQQNDRENDRDFVIAPPPHHPITNNYARHSRKSSRVSWGLQTDSESHIELLESKLNEVISNHKRSHAKSTSMDFDGTPLSTLGYYSEEEIGSGTVFENEDEDTDLQPDNNPQESDEGLWLLWKNQSAPNDGQNNNNDNSTTTNQLWYLPILSRSDNDNNNNNDINNNNYLSRIPRMRNENYVTNYREDSDELNEFPFYEGDEDGLNDEILLIRAKRKREKEYLKFNARSYECCGCNTTNGLCAGLWEGWCCNWVCLPAILFIREKCCCGSEDD